MLVSECSQSLMQPICLAVPYSIPSWRVYRVVAVTDRKKFQDPTKYDYVLSAFHHTYCTPDVVFWLSLDGIENPNAICILIEYDEDEVLNPIISIQPPYFLTQAIGQKDDELTVEFEHDGGRYIGKLVKNDAILGWADQQHVDATIYNISSL